MSEHAASVVAKLFSKVVVQGFSALAAGGLLAGVATSAPTELESESLDIIRSKCLQCHKRSGSAPDFLDSPVGISEKLKTIREVIADESMPPWLPEKGFGDIHEAENLTAAERKKLLAWIDAGAQFTTVTDRLAQDTATQKKPDLTVRLGEPYQIKAGENAYYRNFVIPIELTDRRTVSAIALRSAPDTAASIANAIFTQDIGGFAKTLDRMESEPGFSGVEGGLSASDQVISWSPQSPITHLSSTKNWTLLPTSHLVLRLYLIPGKEPISIQPEIDLYFREAPAAESNTATLHLTPPEIVIPAGESRATVSHRVKLKVSTKILSILPHAGPVCEEIKVFGLLPEQTPAPMLWIKDWNPRWQRSYTFSTPIELPADAELRIQFVYNNTRQNKNQPEADPKVLTWGTGNENEYPGVWFKVAPLDSSQLSSLRQAFAEIELDSLKAAYRFALPSSPSDFQINARLGHILVGENKHEEALPFLNTALKTEPQSWNVHYNIGLTKIARGANAEAATNFERTLELFPDYPPARKAYASVLAMQGKLDDSVLQFQHYLKKAPRDFEAHNNLGVVLARLNRLEEAEASYRSSLELAGANSGVHLNLASLLIQSGRSAEAEKFILESIPLIPEPTAQRLRIQIAQLYAGTGRPQLALEILAEALKIDPNLEAARQGVDALNKALKDLQ